MSKCELLPKGCDCGTTEAAKCQKSEKPKMPEVGQMVIIKKLFRYPRELFFEGEHLAEVKEVDRDEGFFMFSPPCCDCTNCDYFDGDIWELTDKKPMKSREEIEKAIIRMEAEIEMGLDVFHETYYENKIEALKWVLNEI